MLSRGPNEEQPPDSDLIHMYLQGISHPNLLEAQAPITFPLGNIMPTNPVDPMVSPEVLQALAGYGSNQLTFNGNGFIPPVPPPTAQLELGINVNAGFNPLASFGLPNPIPTNPSFNFPNGIDLLKSGVINTPNLLTMSPSQQVLFDFNPPVNANLLHPIALANQIQQLQRGLFANAGVLHSSTNPFQTGQTGFMYNPLSGKRNAIVTEYPHLPQSQQINLFQKTLASTHQHTQKPTPLGFQIDLSVEALALVLCKQLNLTEEMQDFAKESFPLVEPERESVGTPDEEDEIKPIENEDNSASPALSYQASDGQQLPAMVAACAAKMQISVTELTRQMQLCQLSKIPLHATKQTNRSPFAVPPIATCNPLNGSIWDTPPISPGSPISMPTAYTLSQATGSGGAIRTGGTSARNNPIYNVEQRTLTKIRNARQSAKPETVFVYDATYTPIELTSDLEYNPFSGLGHAGGAMKHDRQHRIKVGEQASLFKKLNISEKRTMLNELIKQPVPMSIYGPQPIFLGKFLNDVSLATKVSRCVFESKVRLNLLQEYITMVAGIPSEELSKYLKIAQPKKVPTKLSVEEWEILKPYWCRMAIWLFRIWKNPELFPGLSVGDNQRHQFQPECLYNKNVAYFDTVEWQRLQEVLHLMETPDN